jgi:molybdopterin converting factor subunit 1
LQGGRKKKKTKKMIEVRFFAMLRRIAGVESREYELQEPITVGELKEMITRDIPALAEVLGGRSVLVSVNEEFARDDELVADGDVVGLLPPFSGG